MNVTGGKRQKSFLESNSGSCRGLGVCRFQTSMMPIASTGQRIHVNVLRESFLVSIKLSPSMRMGVIVIVVMVVVVVAVSNSSNEHQIWIAAPHPIGSLRTPDPLSSASIHPRRGQLHANRPPPITPSSQRSQSSPIDSKNVNFNPIPYRREGFP